MVLFKRKQIHSPRTQGSISKVKRYRFVELLQKDMHKWSSTTRRIWIAELLTIKIRTSYLVGVVIITIIQVVRWINNNNKLTTAESLRI